MRERERESETDAGIFLAKGEKDAQMLDVSVWGIDKALHKFESRMPTFQGLGGESLAAGQVADREGGGGERGG